MEEILGIFRLAGRARLVEEDWLDTVTALSGSGPAFVFMFIESLADGAVLNGMSREAAYESRPRPPGAARIILESGMHPGELKDIVASPAGTTIAGIHIMERRAFRPMVIAVDARRPEKPGDQRLKIGLPQPTLGGNEARKDGFVEFPGGCLAVRLYGRPRRASSSSPGAAQVVRLYAATSPEGLRQVRGLLRSPTMRQRSPKGFVEPRGLLRRPTLCAETEPPKGFVEFPGDRFAVRLYAATKPGGLRPVARGKNHAVSSFTRFHGIYFRVNGRRVRETAAGWTHLDRLRTLAGSAACSTREIS